MQEPPTLAQRPLHLWFLSSREDPASDTATHHTPDSPTAHAQLLQNLPRSAPPEMSSRLFCCSFPGWWVRPWGSVFLPSTWCSSVEIRVDFVVSVLGFVSHPVDFCVFILHSLPLCDGLNCAHPKFTCLSADAQRLRTRPCLGMGSPQ